MKCEFPDCKSEGLLTWAKVYLCTAHHEAISAETEKFYKSGDSRPEVMQRPKYSEIDFKITWSKRSLAMSRGAWK